MTKGQLDKEQLGHFRRLLEQRRDEVNRRILVEEEEAKIDLGGVGDPGDISLQTELVDTALTYSDRGTDEYAEIENALARLDRGTYGRCEECGGTISVKRLEVMPTARTCAACAARHEGPPPPTL